MLKKNKGKIILSSAIILLPVLFGIIRWYDLPDMMAIHFGADGNVDGLGGKAFAVFGVPLICLAVHFLCLFVTALDKGQKGQNPKALGMIFWISPMISVLVSGVTYCVALENDVDFSTIFPALLGVPFIFMGNYLPKIKQNRTLGIKIIWALCNEENWNKTHRLGGKVMVAGGFVILLSAFLPAAVSFIILPCVLVAVAFVPMVYSYMIYRQHQKEGIAYVEPPKNRTEKIAAKVSGVVVIIILIGIAVMMFTGDVEVTMKDTSFAVNATYWTDIEVQYAEIDTVEYRRDLNVGIRTNGFHSARLSMGIFQNEEFGTYTLYAYTGAEEFVVLTSDGKTLVIGMEAVEQTQRIYDTVISKLDE